MKEEKSNTQSNSDNNRNANKNKNIKKGMILEKKKESYESRLNRQGFRVSGDLLRIASSGGIRVILVVSSKKRYAAVLSPVAVYWLCPWLLCY